MSLANKTKKERTDLPPRNGAPLHSREFQLHTTEECLLFSVTVEKHVLLPKVA